MSSDIKAGFVGMGNLGSFLCRGLVKTSGLPVTVYDANPDAVDEMVSLGASAAKSPKDLAESCNIVFSLVRDQKQNNQLIFGENGMWEGFEAGDILVIGSTVGPEYMRDLYAKGKERGIKIVDAAVTKITTNKMGIPANYDGWATLMVGGDREDVERAWPVLKSMARYIIHLGGPGTGQAGKLVNNEATAYYAALSRLCFVEYVNLGMKAGLPLEKMVEVWGAGVGGPKFLDSLGLKAWNTEEEIINAVKPRTGTPPVFYDIDGKTPVEGLGELYTRLTREMADDVKADLPLSKLVDQLKASESTTYDTFTETVNRDLQK